ncbi:MAG: phage minor capsid protein [Blautia sp.]|nr:phage minor capsid protein [Blautia sp.]
MKKPDTDKMSLRMEHIWLEAENRIIEDIVRRIKKAGKITSTADYQINRLVEMGKSTEEVERILKEALNATYPEMFKLYDDIAEWQYVRDKDIYEQVNQEFIPAEENEQLKQISAAVSKQTQDTLKNLAQSYGYSVLMGNKRVFTPFSEYYQKYVDVAIMDLLSGAFDYNTVIRRVVTQMTNSGLRTVDYATGHTNRVPVAVRRSILTGVSQITGHLNLYNAKKLGTNYFEVDWHAGARPTHRVWQGRVYSYEELVSVCGLGTVTGLQGANCYHDFYPFVVGASERQWSDEWLDEQNELESRTRYWKGKELDTYGITQKQRKMETAMRAQRSKIVRLKSGGVDADEITIEKARYQAQLYEYATFCNKMGVKQQRERIYMDMNGRLATNTKEQNRKYTPEMLRNAGRDSSQYKHYKNILGDDIGSLEKFRQMKYNEPKKLSVLKKKVDTYSEIDKKDWSSEFKQKSKEAYARFEKEGIYLSVHALSRLPRLNKPGYPSIEETDVLAIVKGKHKYLEGENKLIFFNEKCQLVVAKNKNTDDIVSIIRRKKPKEEWESV